MSKKARIFRIFSIIILLGILLVVGASLVQFLSLRNNQEKEAIPVTNTTVTEKVFKTPVYPQLDSVTKKMNKELFFADNLENYDYTVPGTIKYEFGESFSINYKETAPLENPGNVLDRYIYDVSTNLGTFGPKNGLHFVLHQKDIIQDFSVTKMSYPNILGEYNIYILKLVTNRGILQEVVIQRSNESFIALCGIGDCSNRQKIMDEPRNLDITFAGTSDAVFVRFKKTDSSGQGQFYKILPDKINGTKFELQLNTLEVPQSLKQEYLPL